MSAQFPDVPVAPGVPPVRRQPFLTPGIIPAALITGAIFVLDEIFRPRWGVFTEGGNLVAIPDSVVEVEFRKDARISDYPVEQGGFASYDKVQQPYDARVRFAVWSSAVRRIQFLQGIDAAQNSLSLFVILTPEASYGSANIVHYDYRRTARKGINILEVDVWFTQVRVTTGTQFSQTKTPAGAAQQSGGQVQATAPPASATVPNGNVDITIQSIH